MARKQATADKKKPEFQLDVETRFELTGRGKALWFNPWEPDKYGKIGGKFIPENPKQIKAVVDDLIAEAQAQCDEAGITVTQVRPEKKTDDGETYYTITRAATKKDGSAVSFKFRNIRGKLCDEPEDDIGNGSILNIKYYATAYYMAEATTAGITIPARIGVSLSPLEIQIIDHKVYTADDGFADESGGDYEEEDGDETPWGDESDDGSSDY